MPQGRDKQIGSIELGDPVRYNTGPDHFVIGDIWAAAWAADDTLYMLSDDFRGWQNELLPGGRNVSFCRLDGRPEVGGAAQLRGSVVNDLPELGIENELGDDNACWKGSGIAAIDGALYMFLSRQWYGLSHPGRRETKHDSYLLRSDDHGLTWQWSSRSGAPSPMFPGPGFAAPYFVEYGQDGSAPHQDGADRYVYAVSTDGAWDNGDCMTLARVAREKLRDLDAADWQFYHGGDGGLNSSWGGLGKAEPILSAVRKCSMTGMHYLPATSEYLIIQWHYPVLTPTEHQTNSTVWEFYIGSHPWGLFNKVGEHRWPDTGLYNPYLPNKFLSGDALSATILASGDFRTSSQGWESTNYTLWTVPIRFEISAAH